MTALKKQHKEELKSIYKQRAFLVKIQRQSTFRGAKYRKSSYERVKFLSIAGSNLDEFYGPCSWVIQSNKQEVDSLSSDGLTPEEQMDEVCLKLKSLKKQNKIFIQLIMELKKNNINLVKPVNLNTKDKKTFRNKRRDLPFINTISN